MHKLVVSIVRQEKLEDVISALKKERIPFTYSRVKGFCGEVHLYQKDIHERIKIEIVAKEQDAVKVKKIIMENACCGLEGDGCLAVYVIDEFTLFNL